MKKALGAFKPKINQDSVKSSVIEIPPPPPILKPKDDMIFVNILQNLDGFGKCFRILCSK